MDHPDLDDYIKLFGLYDGEKLHAAEAEGIELLFEQAVRMIVRPSEFNHRLPLPFIEAADNYLNGDPATRKHFQYEENRQFMLSDLYDFIQLQALRRARSSTNLQY